jgi:hypothetical protein
MLCQTGQKHALQQLLLAQIHVWSLQTQTDTFLSKIAVVAEFTLLFVVTEIAKYKTYKAFNETPYINDLKQEIL